jgi:hypothetical protein
MAPWNGNIFTNWHKAFLRSRKVRTKAENFSKGNKGHADEPTSVSQAFPELIPLHPGNTLLRVL